MIKIDPYGNCFYCCISYFLYKNQNHHLQIRENIFNYIRENRNLCYIFFQDYENNNNNYSVDELLDQYIFENNKDGEYAGELEYKAACKIYKLRIIILSLGFFGYNVYNILEDEDYNTENYKTLYILFINKNHFNFLEIKKNYEESNKERIKLLDNLCKNNLSELEKLRKKEFPISNK